jgi:hypothetical protein
MDDLYRMEIERLRALLVAAYPYPPEGPLVEAMAAVMGELPPGWEPPAALRALLDEPTASPAPAVRADRTDGGEAALPSRRSRC